jgi:hypothetical protein
MFIDFKTLPVDHPQWIPASEDQIGLAKPETPTAKKKETVTVVKLWEKMSPTQKYTRQDWQTFLKKEFDIGIHRANGLLDTLMLENLVRMSLVERKGTNDLKLYEKIIEPASAADPEASNELSTSHLETFTDVLP